MPETPTATTQGDEPGPAPAAAKEETPFSPPQEAAPEEKPSLGVETEPTKTEEEFKGSIDDLWDHERLGDRKEQIKTEATTQGRLQAQQELAPLIEGGTQEFGRLTQQMRSLLGRFNKAANDGTLDENAVSSLLADHGEVFATLNRVTDQGFQSQLKNTAYEEFLTALAQDMNDVSLAGDFRGRLPYAARGMDKEFIPDLRKRIISKVATDAEEKGYQRGLTENRGAASERERLESRQGQGANLAPGSPAGGRSDEELKLDPNTPVETLREIRARERLAG